MQEVISMRWEIVNDHPNLVIHYRNRNTLSRKIGRVSGLVKEFFSRDQTKASVLISYWTLETFLTLAILLSYIHPLVAVGVLTAYCYGSYSLWGAVNILSRKESKEIQ
jgi:hypothetical protein